jgi:hypothetical protein
VEAKARNLKLIMKAQQARSLTLGEESSCFDFVSLAVFCLSPCRLRLEEAYEDLLTWVDCEDRETVKLIQHGQGWEAAQLQGKLRESLGENYDAFSQTAISLGENLSLFAERLGIMCEEDVGRPVCSIRLLCSPPSA